MVQYDPKLYLPTAEELPCSDDTPVDNELQNFVPNLLLSILAHIWAERMDWYFGVDMGIYYVPGQYPQVPIIPDGFLSVGVERRKSHRGRLSYVLWEEDYISPILVLEVVSQKYGGEYDSKMSKYTQLGALYYVTYNPDYYQRDKHDPFEVYRLTEGQYVKQVGEPFWLPEIGLGIGRSQGTYEGWTREWLYWFDQQGNRYLNAEELLAEERRLREDLLEKLRQRGINPDEL